MRVTTQMLNETARRAGLPLHQTSLLDYVNNSVGGTGNALLDALNNSGSTSSAASLRQKNNYEKLEKSADELEKSAEVFLAEGEKSIFDKVKKDGNTEDLYKSVEALVKSYNNTMDNLKSASGTLNSYYRQMLKEAVTENEAALSEIGITLSKNGTLNLDKDKMKAAGVEAVEKALGTSSTFSEKAIFLAERISDNAGANAESLSNQYNSNGNTYSALQNKYDFRG